METALREALDKAETQAIRFKKKLQAKKRQPKEEKLVAEPQLARPRKSAKTNGDMAETRQWQWSCRKIRREIEWKWPCEIGDSGNRAFLSRHACQFAEPHVVRSSDSVALRPIHLKKP